MEPRAGEQLPKAELRNFGLALGALFAGLFGLLPLLRHRTLAQWPWILAAVPALDDLAREQEYPPEHVEPAIEFFRRIREAGLVRDDDARAIWIALDAARSLSVPAAKARSWAIGTVANIAAAMVNCEYQGRMTASACASVRFAC